MRILLIYPQPDKYKKPRFGFSYEMLIIASVLSKYHKVLIRDFSCENYKQNEFVEYILENKIDVVFLECDSFALKRSQNIIHARKLINIINTYAITIAYGNYCYITKKDFDSASYTVKNNDINEIIKIINKIDNGIKISFICNFDDLPYINRELLNSISYYRNNKKNTLLQTSKGCENTCVFCQRKGWQDKYISHSYEYILKEIEIVKNQEYRNVWITDENFTFNLVRAKTLLKLVLQRNLHENMNFFISSWANIDYEFIDLAKKCNVKIISFGIESGNKEILDFYRKNIDINNIPKIIKYANSLGIFTVGNFIIGAPMETYKTIEETFRLINLCQFDQVNIKNLDYMIGSCLYEGLEESYKIKDHVFACLENGLTFLKLEEIKKIKNDFLKGYYENHKKVIMKKIADYGPPF